MNLKAENLIKHYPPYVTAVDNFTYLFKKGKSYAILGPSGSGKSTLLYLLSGIEKPNSGIVWLDQIPFSQYKERQRTQLRAQYFGFVFQRFYLIPYLSALENVLLKIYLKDKSINNKVIQGARQLLARLGITSVSKKPYAYSGGEQQRIAIARAIITQPKILIADEPTGNLDSKTSKEVFKLLVQYKERSTIVIIATHDVTLAKMCDEILTLQDGKLVQLGT